MCILIKQFHFTTELKYITNTNKLKINKNIYSVLPLCEWEVPKQAPTTSALAALQWLLSQRCNQHITKKNQKRKKKEITPIIIKHPTKEANLWSVGRFLSRGCSSSISSEEAAADEKSLFIAIPQSLKIETRRRRELAKIQADPKNPNPSAINTNSPNPTPI